MKKYNCWEDVKEAFAPEKMFECEGEIFELYSTTTRKNNGVRYGIVVKSSPNCIAIIKHKFAYDIVYVYYKVG